MDFALLSLPRTTIDIPRVRVYRFGNLRSLLDLGGSAATGPPKGREAFTGTTTKQLEVIP